MRMVANTHHFSLHLDTTIVLSKLNILYILAQSNDVKQVVSDFQNM